MIAASLIALSLQATPAPLSVPVAGGACLSASETRAAIQRNKLADPMATLRSAGRKQHADPLRSRLCRWGDKFVYEIALLRRDGKVIRVFLDAANGLEVSAQP
jgi:hypothetical protein